MACDGNDATSATVCDDNPCSQCVGGIAATFNAIAAVLVWFMSPSFQVCSIFGRCGSWLFKRCKYILVVFRGVSYLFRAFLGAQVLWISLSCTATFAYMLYRSAIVSLYNLLLLWIEHDSGVSTGELLRQMMSVVMLGGLVAN